MNGGSTLKFTDGFWIMVDLFKSNSEYNKKIK